MIEELKDIPILNLQDKIKPMSVPGYDPKKSYDFHYEENSHNTIPHVVKFSGGRSSGMLLSILLKSGILNPKRGDVVVFNNTSAEHPATYEFVTDCKKMTEEYGVPFFWIEFQTYEDSVNGEWTRIPTYKLVNSKSFSDKNPHGYKSHGEVFEEMLSLQSYVPNLHRRTCTAIMKIQATRRFLKDWFTIKNEIGRCGHYYEKSMITPKIIEEMHIKNRGNTPKEILLEKKKFLLSCPPHRPAQKFSDYTNANISIYNSQLAQNQNNGRASMSGDDCMEYLSFVGFRADEPRRVAKMLKRNKDADGLIGDDGEHVYAPLAHMGICRENVEEFWRAQSWGLDLPYDTNLSNCVFCFLKGTKNIVELIALQEKDNNAKSKKTLSPSNIHWWASMEKKYGRDLVKENRPLKKEHSIKNPIIGFFGVDGRVSYDLLIKRAAEGKQSKGDADYDTMPCDCTD